jgi:hypothetical protein
MWPHLTTALREKKTHSFIRSLSDPQHLQFLLFSLPELSATTRLAGWGQGPIHLTLLLILHTSQQEATMTKSAETPLPSSQDRMAADGVYGRLYQPRAAPCS